MCPPWGRKGNIWTAAEFVPRPKRNVLRHWFHRSCDTVFLGGPKLLVEMVHKLVLLRTPTKKRSQGMRSGDLGGQNWNARSSFPTRSSRRWGRDSFRKRRKSRCQWGWVPSCWKMKSSESSLIWGRSHFCSIECIFLNHAVYRQVVYKDEMLTKWGLCWCMLQVKVCYWTVHTSKLNKK